jgi:hypothetical protein
MASKVNLMNLGLPYALANRLATEPVIATAQGGTRASAATIGGTQFLTCYNASNSGAGAVLPVLGGDGCLLGDDFIINNQIVGGMTIYAPTGFAISMAGSLQSGSGGVALNSHTTTTLFPVTASTWIGVVGG